MAAVSPEIRTNVQDDLGLALVESVSSTLLHAVANCTNVVLGRVGILQLSRPDDRELERLAEEVRSQLEGIAAIAASTREFVAARASDARTANVRSVLDQSVDAFAADASSRDIRVHVAPFAHDLCVAFPAASLRAIVHGLLGFAIRVAPPSTVVDVAVSRGASSVVLAVSLPASYVLPDRRRELRAPWLSGRIDDAGARLLLALGLSIVNERGGRSEIVDAGGTRRCVAYLPARVER